MNETTIRIYGDPILKKPAQPVAAVTDATRQLVATMLTAMRNAGGVGLAAPQIGRTEAVCVIELPPDYDLDEQKQRLNPGVTMPLVLINPVIKKMSKRTETLDEGCLSFPEISAAVSRAWEIQISYLDLEGTQVDRILQGFMARAAQHEIDHLNGILLVDRMSYVKKLALGGRLKKLKQEAAEAAALGEA